MAITRIKNSSIANKGPKYDTALAGLPYRPVIGTATDGGTGTTVSVAFTENNVAGAGITYTALSDPGNLTATGPASPITVTGLTSGTAYTFQVKAGNILGDSAYSAASNSVTPVVPKPVVTGGTLTSDSTYYYRAFTSSGTLGVTGASLTADVLCVAGGGGGTGVGTPTSNSVGYGGGGGAGGLTYYASQSLSVANYTVTVGAGGAGGNAADSAGTVGGDSQFGNLTKSDGGGGGSSSGNNGGAGGSGGGGRSNIRPNTGVVNAKTGGNNNVAGQGNPGGSAWSGGEGYPGGGGGYSNSGLSSVNANSTPSGGNGTSSYSTWANVTSTGASGSYAGGGGAGSISTGNFRAGGSGGGGNGSDSSPNAGTANSGGGGGGASGQSNALAGAQGGSGVVIVRYTKSQVD